MASDWAWWLREGGGDLGLQAVCFFRRPHYRPGEQVCNKEGRKVVVGVALRSLISFRPHVGACNLVEVVVASLEPSALEPCKGANSLVEVLPASSRRWWPP